MTDAVLAEAEKLIPADFRMISGCRDEQTSADVSNVASFQLPDPAGRSGGACTSALLKILYADHHKPDEDLSFQEVLLKMRDILSSGRYTQIPQLSGSRPLDIHLPFTLVPSSTANGGGTRYAVMIGINYVGQQGELSGCHNDVLNMKDYIMDVWGYKEDNITVLLDDGNFTNPTRANILKAFKDLVAKCQPGDCAYCHYSGHGGRLRDEDGDEADGYDETLVPVNYTSDGQIRDDDLFKTLVGPMRKGVTVTCVMDCCHSGTVLDLPYKFIADGEHEGMTAPEDFDFSTLMNLATGLAASGNTDDMLAAAISQCCNIL